MVNIITISMSCIREAKQLFIWMAISFMEISLISRKLFSPWAVLHKDELLENRELAGEE